MTYNTTTPAPISASGSALVQSVTAGPVGFIGGTSVGLNLYTVTDEALSVPIRISNAVRGVRVADIPTRVGSGWQLIAGGAVVREVRGSPDEGNFRYSAWSSERSIGYLQGGADKGDEAEARTQKLYNALEALRTEPNGSCDSELWSEWNKTWLNGKPPFTNDWRFTWARDLDRIGFGIYDTESDVYHYSFPGHSGTFRFDRNGNPIEEVVSDARIEYGSNLMYFKITSPDGIVAWFGNSGSKEIEKAYDKSLYGATRGGFESSTNDALITSWKLVKIEDPNSDAVIVFDYELQTYMNHRIPWNSARLGPARVGVCEETCYELVEASELISIESNHEIIEFGNGGLREDLVTVADLTPQLKTLRGSFQKSSHTLESIKAFIKAPSGEKLAC